MRLRLLGLVSPFVFVFGACAPDFVVREDGGIDAGRDATVDAPTDTGGAHDSAPPPADAASGGDASDAGTPISDAGGDTTMSDTGTADAGILEDCVLLMHFEEPSWTADAGGSVIDNSGAGNNGTPLGTATTIANGKFGRAASFDGTGAVLVPDSPSLQVTDQLTYAAWIYATYLDDAGVRYPGIIAKRTDYVTDVAFTMFLWTNYNLYGDLEQPDRFFSNTVFTTGQWYHVAIVYDGTQPNPNGRAVIYVNGQVDSIHGAPTSLMPHTSDLKVGYLQQGTADPDPNAGFIGYIDEAAVWTRALSGTEIQSLYNATGPL